MASDGMKLLWVTRSVEDYRVPVFAALRELTRGHLRLLYSRERSSERVNQKIRDSLGEAAVGMSGERRLRGGRLGEGMANRWWLVTYQPGIGRAIEKEDPDVIIADGFFQWTAPALWFRIRKGVPLVVCYERTAYTERRAQWYRSLYRRLALRYVDAMCCNGRLSLEYTQSLGMPAGRITTGHMAADNDGLKARAEAISPARRKEVRRQWSAQGTVLLYVGQWNHRKGVRQLLDAWALLEKAAPGQATLILVGGGPEEANLRAQAERLALMNVRFLGRVDYDSLADYYVAADAFIIPTLEDNWSLVVPEAMACGLPVLCSKYNGCWPELVKESNGWVFDPLDAQDTLATLRTALASADRLPAMGQASRAIVSEHSPARAAQAILDACHIAREHRGG